MARRTHGRAMGCRAVVGGAQRKDGAQRPWCVSTALRDALRLRPVSRNVATAAPLPRLDRRALRAWNTDAIRRFLLHVQADRWSTMWRLFARTGVRRGEALGLRWKDVDFDADVIAIANTRTVVTGRVVSGPPKTRAGERTIA